MISYTEQMEARNRILDAGTAINKYSNHIEYQLLDCRAKAESQSYIEEFERISNELLELNLKIVEKADLH